MQAIILAGGKGTRFRAVTTTLPKLLVPLNNKPLIDYIVEHVKNNGCDNIIICTGYLGDKIQNYIDSNNFGIPIKVSREDKPLGTAGALRLIKDQLEDEFFILYGDIYTTINLRGMLKFHKKRGAVVTAAIHPSSHPWDSDLVEYDKNFRITKILKKTHVRIPKNYYSVAALYLVNSDIKKYLSSKTSYDFAHDLLPKLLGENLPIYGYNTSELIMDIGTPKRLAEAEKLL